MRDDELDATMPGDQHGGEVGPESRRQACDGHSAHPPCRRCGGAVTGRRRNGYCSDACRLQDRREQDRRRHLELLDTIIRAVEELRAELGAIWKHTSRGEVEQEP
jgi:hypothetical protein